MCVYVCVCVCVDIYMYIYKHNSATKNNEIMPFVSTWILPFHTVYRHMGIKKDRNGKDLTEAEEFKKRWQEYTELY